MADLTRPREPIGWDGNFVGQLGGISGGNHMERRAFLKSVGVSTAAVMAGVSVRSRGAAAAETSTGWRAFEVTTKVGVMNPSGATRVWLPLPLAAETDYHKPLG